MIKNKFGEIKWIIYLYNLINLNISHEYGHD